MPVHIAHYLVAPSPSAFLSHKRLIQHETLSLISKRQPGSLTTTSASLCYHLRQGCTNSIPEQMITTITISIKQTGSQEFFGTLTFRNTRNEAFCFNCCPPRWRERSRWRRNNLGDVQCRSCLLYTSDAADE